MHRLIGLVILTSLISCSSDRDIREYYFPVRQLTDGLIYAYENTGNLSEREMDYWYFLGLEQDTALYLSATHYADGQTPDQVARERITNTGVILEELTLFPQDTSGARAAVNTELLFDRIFPFVIPADGIAAGYRLRFANPGNPDALTYVTLNRNFRGDTTLSVLGENTRAIVYDLAAEVSERDPEDGDISPTFTGYEIYAEGIGLVEFRRNLGAGITTGGKLSQRMSMKEYLEN